MYLIKAIPNSHPFNICPKRKAQKNQSRVWRTGELYLLRKRNRIQVDCTQAIESFIRIKILLKIKELHLEHKPLIKNFRIKLLFLTESSI